MKKLVTLITLLSYLAGEWAFAACSQPVTLLQENTPAPCRGYLFTPEKEHEVFKLKENYKLLNEELGIKDKQLNIYKNNDAVVQEAIKLEQQKSELWRAKAEDSTKKLIESESGRGTRDILFIGLGVLLTIGAGFAIGQAARK